MKPQQPTRERAAFQFQIETAAEGADGRFRISGIMNSFGVTHSRRVLCAAPFEAWCNQNPKATLPMLANHGEVAGFGTIGIWDGFERVPGGMRWTGYLAKGVPLADQARMLLEQNVLRQLSVGWVSRQARYVSVKDKDLDPELQQALADAAVDEALAYIDWYPVEGSIVDVGDDPRARVAAELEVREFDYSGLATQLGANLAPALNEMVSTAVRTALDERLKAAADDIESRVADLVAAHLATMDPEHACCAADAETEADDDAADVDAGVSAPASQDSGAAALPDANRLAQLTARLKSIHS